MKPATPEELKALVDNGTLHEVNRLLLHPMGLALAVDDDKSTVYMIRDDDPVIFDVNEEKAEAFQAAFKARCALRKSALTFAIQPAGKALTISPYEPSWVESTAPAAQAAADIEEDVWQYIKLVGGDYPDLAELYSLTYETNGTWESVDFLGRDIWNNQDDDVPWDDEKGAPVRSLKDHLLLRMQETIEDLALLAAFCKENMAVTG